PVGVGENEAAKVADELLRAGPHRGKVVIGTEIGQLGLKKPLFQCVVKSRAGRAFADVRIDDRQLIDDQMIDVENLRDLDSPIGGLERGVAMDQIERQDHVVLQEELIRVAE